MNTTTKVLGGFLLGAVVGAASGLLLAPHNGNQNRKFLKRKSKRYSRQAMEAVASYLMSLKNGYQNKIARLTTHEPNVHERRIKK